ncbi:T9SS type A sorting domain-containing protein [Flavobacterium caseinilyticum]|uniref:T9SS type A sorting domain-containing protein n=1 Tax=Flavobacterium caseinilyticum TaxID=2541732 RepID=A0A4R5AYY2_9FLAO|nr:T9SS type A sorting domain-containing protein [Flavobacterium caseinilyticum]TDD78788.1 T9SS type A sorting domain-containing protein [Flavobacterium caseinilyticum]
MKSKQLKRPLLIIVGFLFQISIHAQIFVSPDSYLFANNEVVFIKQQLELKAVTSNFYLRKDAQLIQGSTTLGTNKGLGNLSVFQEGTTNNFQFNYWCSPVGGSTDTEGNSKFGIQQLKDIDGLITFKEPTILPMNNYNGTASPLAIAPHWINKLSASSSYYDWVQVGSSANLNPGEGFTMKGTSGTNYFTLDGVQNNPGNKQRYDFRGKPNDGTISIPVAIGKFTLTGNPYPSAIDLSAFLLNEVNCTGIAYFWEHDKTVNTHYIAQYKGGYGAFSPGSMGSNGIYVPATYYTYDNSGNTGADSGTKGAIYQRRFCPIGQGFMIDGVTNGTVTMKNNYRVFVKENAANASQFEKIVVFDKNKSKSGYLSSIQSVSGFDYRTVSTEPTPQIRFNTLMNNEGIRQIVLAFIPEATDGVDRALDAMSPSADSPADVYFVIENGEYVINATNFDIDKKIQIGFKNKLQANYKITVNEIVNCAAVNQVYLHDKKTDLFHDIKNNFYDLTLPAGVNNTQFEITFKTNTTLDVEDIKSQSFIVYQNNTTKSLTIDNPLLMDISTCGLYDVAGKLIFNKKDLGVNPSYTFSTSGLSSGIYIVKVITTDKIEMGQKIIIKN